MDTNNKNAEHRDLYKRLLLVLVTVVVTAVIFSQLAKQYPGSSFFNPDTSFADTLTTDESELDSVKLANHKQVPLSSFQSSYSAEDWYARFEANKVAFDEAYDKRAIDIHGKIHQISNDHDCSQIVIKGSDDGVMNYIEFSNCMGGKDRWSDEVMKTAVGQDVQIRGIYSGQLSNSYEMYLYNCHIINEK